MIDKRLKLFQQIWELKSFSAAAAMLGMTQPNATMQLKRLEEELGVRLLERDTRSIRLTPEGRTLLAELGKLNAAAEQLQRKLAGLGRGIRNFAIGGTQTAGNFVLPELMAAYMHRHRSTHLHLSIGNTAAIAEKIQQGFLELALVEGPFDRNLFLYRKFADDELLATGRPELLARTESLAGYLKGGGRLLLREAGSGTRYHFDRFCVEQRIEVPPSQTLVIESLEAIKELAIDGVGISFLSPLATRRERRYGLLECAPVGEGRILRELNFIHTPDADLKFVEPFLDFCQSAGSTGDSAT